MFPERAFETLQYLLQIIISYVPYFGKAEHVDKNTGKNYASVSHKISEYVRSSYLFDILLYLNERIWQSFDYLTDSLSDSHKRQILLQDCFQQLFYVLRWIRDFIIAMILLPYTLFMATCSIGIQILQWVILQLQTFILYATTIIGIIKEIVSFGFKVIRDMLHGKFSGSDIMDNIITGVQSSLVTYMRYNDQSYISRMLDAYEILPKLQKLKRKIKPIHKKFE